MIVFREINNEFANSLNNFLFLQIINVSLSICQYSFVQLYNYLGLAIMYVVILVIFTTMSE